MTTGRISSNEDGSTRGAERGELALFGAGCFWGVEHILRDTPGVLDTEVGYAGGDKPRPTYEDICTGKTGHAEVVLVRFDPATLSYKSLLGIFFRLHDPTTLNRQGNDRGTQYRSVIFARDPTQTAAAQETIVAVTASGKWPRPVMTEVKPWPEFWSAETYHQDYLVKNPGGYNCHVLRDP